MDKQQGLLDPLFNCEYERRKDYPRWFKEYRRKWTYYGKEQIVADFPMNLDLEASTDCQLKCPICMRQRMPKLPRDYMTFHDFARYINEAVKYNSFYCWKPNYRGESTLHPKLPMFMEFAKEKGVKEIMLNTNGQYPMYLNNQIAPFISEIAFSIDAFKPETYSKVRPGGKAGLPRLVENVKTMIELRDRAYPDMRVRVAFVVQKANASEANDFYRYWKNQGVDKIVMNQCYTPGQKGDNRGTVQWVQDDDYVCPQIFQRLVITPLGEVLPCCGAFDESISLGNIKREKKTIRDYWIGSEMEGLRDLHINHMYKQIPTCKTCALTYRPVKVEQ